MSIEAKPKYNQGDIAQYTNMDGSKELLVITEVFELSIKITLFL